MFAKVNERFSDWLWRNYLRAFARLSELRRDEEGQDLAEYAIIAGIVIAGTIGLIMRYGDKVREWWTRLVNSM